MIHIRTDNEELNSKRRFACGIGPALPEGDKYFFDGESAVDRQVDCPACRAALGFAPEKAGVGVPLKDMTHAQFVEIARSWGYD